MKWWGGRGFPLVFLVLLNDLIGGLEKINQHKNCTKTEIKTKKFFSCKRENSEKWLNTLNRPVAENRHPVIDEDLANCRHTSDHLTRNKLGIHYL